MKNLSYDEELNRLNTMWEYERAKKTEGFINIAGVDEAGRGPLAGAVFAACYIT